MEGKPMFVSVSGNNSTKFKEAVAKSKANPYDYKVERKNSKDVMKDLLTSLSNSLIKNESTK